MATPAAKSRFPLIHQLFFSHLIVAFVGLVMLGIALIATYDLRNRILVLAQDSGPLAQASFQLLAGVHSSLANLHGWTALGDHRFLVDWHSTWQEQILPALDSLNLYSHSSKSTGYSDKIKALQSTLADLEESQWWIQDQVRTPGNEPSRLLYLREIEPNAAKLHSLLVGLAQIEQEKRPSIQLLSTIDAIRQQFSTTHLLLREILGPMGASYMPPLVNHLTTLQSEIDRLQFNPLLTPEQQEIDQLLQREFKAFAAFSRESIRLRQSSSWNVALQIMRQETDWLSQQAIALTHEIAKQAKARLEKEMQAAQTATTITVWSLLLTILVMVVVAYAVSKNRADALVKPITSLLEAAQQLTIGNLHTDIPIQRTDELGALTQSFNSLREAMQATQQKLRVVNVSLEQRVAQRTADLETVNQILIHEIHIRNQTELALRDSEARLRAMTRAIPDLVFVVDEDGCYREILAAERRRPLATAAVAAHDDYQDPITAVDSQYPPELQILSKKSAIVGVTPIRDRFLHEVHSAEKAQFFLDIIHRALATQHIQIAEYELETASGVRWFESRTSPLDVKFDSKAAVIVVAHDITKRKQGEAQLRQAQKMQAIGQLTGGIAHDFNNLLAVIMGNLELLNEQLSHHTELHAFAQQALKAVDRGTYLTRRLLAFSRRQPLLAQPTDLNKLVLGMLDLMRRTLGVTIQIDTQLAEDLDYTLVDPDQLESALLNLVINARDAMPQGGRLTLQTANILIEEEYATLQLDMQPGPYVMLVVGDTGVGMSPKVLERAFEPFFTTKDTGKGSGFGLSIVYGLVKQSGGHITIDSQLNQGTTIRLYFPPTQKSLQMALETPATDASVQGNGETILVVEDDAAVRLFAINALRSLGYQTLEAPDAKVALQLLEIHPDIVLLFTDIVMPGEMDGVQLAQEAQCRYPNLRVLYTSGYTEHTLIDTGHQVTGVEVLIKPYRKADLGHKLQRLLG